MKPNYNRAPVERDVIPDGITTPIQLAGVTKWPVVPFDCQVQTEDLNELYALYNQKECKLPVDLKTQIRRLMFIKRLTEGKMRMTTKGTHHRDLEIGLNDSGRVLLSALRAEDTSWEILRASIHSIPIRDDEKFEATKFEQYESKNCGV